MKNPMELVSQPCGVAPTSKTVMVVIPQTPRTFMYPRGGSSVSAKVYNATYLGCTFAVKRFKIGSGVLALQQELDVLCQLRHPRICQLVGFSVQTAKRKCAIVMDFMSKDLRRLIKTRKKKKSIIARGQACVPFDLSESLHIIKQIALGMQFIHARCIAHRGLKPDNVLAEERGGCIEVKVADFGVSHHIDSSERPKGAVEILLLQPSHKDVEGNEVEDIDLKASDVYSFAMTCYEILTVQEPFKIFLSKSRREVIGVTSGRLPLTLPSDLNPRLKSLMEKLPFSHDYFDKVCSKDYNSHKHPRSYRTMLALAVCA